MDSDVKAGLKLSPSVRDVRVSDRPVDDVRFVQYRAKIAGSIHCLGTSLVLFFHCVNSSSIGVN